MSNNIHTQSLKAHIDGLKNGDFSSVELTQHYLDRISQFDSSVNSFITHTSEQALAQAKAADELRAAGSVDVQKQPLAGVPFAHKDIFCTQGVLTTAGSKMLSNFVSPYSATVVEKCSQAGLISLGKLNMDEFAMGSSNEKSYFGAVQNPWHGEHVPGGSSGGSAAAVAAGFVPVTTGTDTGGSIRQPASFCGITGIKPTYGRVSRFGMIAYASSLDQAGSFGKSAEDCAYLLQAMAGHDTKDSTSVERPVDDYVGSLKAASDKPLAGLKIGIASEYFANSGDGGLDAEVKVHVEAAIDHYKTLGAEIVEVHISNTDAAIAAYYLLAPAEASSNLSRFDGVRYGYRCDDPADLLDMYQRSRAEGFGEEVKRRIMIGTYALSAGYYDAYYVKAQKVRQLIANDFAKAFAKDMGGCDVIASPTAPTTAYKLGSKPDPVSMYLGDVYTIATNLAGLPAISHPVGFDSNGLPIGMQLIGNYWQEAQLLNTVHQYQLTTDFHTQLPDLSQTLSPKTKKA